MLETQLKALVKKRAEGGLWLGDVPIPEIAGNEVLIKIHKTAICGTDVHIYNWDNWAQKTIQVPMVSGHEYAGEIVEVGENVTGLSIGDIVSGEGHIVCGRCRNCLAGRLHLCPNTKGVGVNRDGAFAEYLAIPATNVFRPSVYIPTDLLAIFDPYGNVPKPHCLLTWWVKTSSSPVRDPSALWLPWLLGIAAPGT